MSAPFDYRADVDGLRAIAVLAVIIFHAFADMLPGGFVGVDVFFVISGYLITKILLQDLERRTFSLSHFYAKRIKRIFPALTTVLIFCLALGWLILSAGEYKFLGRYTAGGAVFLNNFLLWRDAGYFDPEAATKPLLHLWSLAIEEQFYLVWPLLLFICHRYLRWPHATLMVMVALLLGSLSYSYYLVQSDLTADFYSPLSRTWELALGALLAYWQIERSRPIAPNASIVSIPSNALPNPQHLNQALSLVGIGLLAASLTLLHEHLAFPGLWVLMPTLGTACLIAAAPTSVFHQRVLVQPALVWVGLISYPLYLWHWPLLSFARILEGQTPSATLRFALVGLSFILAYFTYRWIERPIRYPRKDAKRMILAKCSTALLCLVMIGLLVVGYALVRSDGLAWRHDQRLQADPRTMVVGQDRDLLVRACGLTPTAAAGFEWCLSQNKKTTPNFAVIGDSKAEALYYGLAREAPMDQNWLLMGSFAVAQIMPAAIPSLLEESLRRLESDPAIQTVVIAYSFRHIFSADKNTKLINQSYSQEQIRALASKQNQVIQRLQLAGKQLVFFVDHPTLPDPRSCIKGQMTELPLLRDLLVRNANPYCQISYQNHVDGLMPYRQMIQILRSFNTKLLVFDPLDLLCDRKENLCSYHENANFLYSYGDHLSDYANSKIARHLLPQLNR